MVLHNGYGVTESSPTIAQTRPEAARKDTSIGPALPGVEVRLAGIDQRPVSDGDVGELWVRGPNVMKGYYHAPEETAAAFNSEGWYNTRDLARMEDGNLFIAGRTKELIVRFGFNVYPSEVEAVLDTHPAVVRSAVVGRTSQGVDGNEEIVAFVQPLPDSDVTPNDLVEYAALHLAVYRRPSEIVFLPTMPLTPTGKVAKSELMRNREST
jgi:acyl-CoA synthetase (AMP-forming)/AMP-acid ligase II